MTHKGNGRAIEAVESKSSGTKRAVGEGEVKAPHKRQKTKPSPKLPEPWDQKQEQPWAVDPDQVFRFLDLPAEIRNQIYEEAAAWTKRCFPHTWPKEKASIRRHSKASPAPESHRPETKPIPYLSLTQVCSLIRSEFRPLHLSTHRFPLFALDSYLKVFFPLPTASTDRKRFNRYHSANGTLRLWITKDGLGDTNIFNLLKHKVRFPSYTVIPEAFSDIPAATLSSISALINNNNETFLKWIKSNIITQVRLAVMMWGVTGQQIRVVIKEKYAPAWMRPISSPDSPFLAEYIESLGLDKLGWKVAFGVDYS